MTEAEVECGGLTRTVKLWHMHFPWNGGSWSYFLCPHCGRKCQILRLYDGRLTCRLCDGLGRDRGKNIERLRQTLALPRVKFRRGELEISLRRALIAKRRDKLKGWRNPKSPDLDPELILKALTKAEGSILKPPAPSMSGQSTAPLLHAGKTLTEAALEATKPNSIKPS